jgi:glycosyltransferase involved in cell wall biosynthesis
MKLSVIAPVKDEAPWIGYSILSCLDQMHEFIYALDSESQDGTRELLHHVKDKYAHEKLTIIDFPTFHPSDTKAYNEAFNVCIRKSTGDSCFFYHPDMVVTNPEAIEAMADNALAWWTNVTSFAGDFHTVISKGRCDKWKNIHARKFDLNYFGGYGSQNEDFYHSNITGKSTKHFGTEFSKYPFVVRDSGINVSHFCELKSYKRRLEKMKLCLKTQYVNSADHVIEELASQHPRVTLEPSSKIFGTFEFKRDENAKEPDVVQKYKHEFSKFVKEAVYA